MTTENRSRLVRDLEGNLTSEVLKRRPSPEVANGLVLLLTKMDHRSPSIINEPPFLVTCVSLCTAC